METQDAAVDAAQPHEAAAVDRLHAGRVGLDDERADLALLFAVHLARRRLR